MAVAVKRVYDSPSTADGVRVLVDRLWPRGMTKKDAAIKFVDDREGEAQLRFEQIKSEMTGRSAAANLVRKDSGEA